MLRYFFAVFLSIIFTLGAEGKYKVKYIVKKVPPRASIVADAKTGEILYASNPDIRTQPASMTKMMTLKLVFKALREKKISPKTMIRISAHAAEQKPSKIGFKEGDYITVRNAILALITKSANDVAVALAEHIGGSEKRFVRMMNNEARRLRMYSTTFCNASGWKNTSQLTTVRDMLKLSRALISEYPEFFPLFSTQVFYYKGKCHKNHNHLLGENGGITVDGLKTGFVCASGYNIAVTARKGHERVIVVVVGGKTAKKRDALVQWLLTCSFNKLAERRYLAENKRRSCAEKLLLLKSNNTNNNGHKNRNDNRNKSKKNHSSINQLLLNNTMATTSVNFNSQITFKKSDDYNKINSNTDIATNIALENNTKENNTDRERNNEENGKRETNPIEQRTQSSNENNGKSEQRSSGILGKSRRNMRRFL